MAYKTQRHTNLGRLAVGLLIHSNALKHGLTEDQLRQAYDTGAATAKVRDRDQHSDPTRWATIGIDAAGRPIELVFILTDTGPLIFHANYCTNGFRKELTR
ncbi:MAG: hypothetical protein ACRCWS_06270 [Propionibacteriaceae bacterium]